MRSLQARLSTGLIVALAALVGLLLVIGGYSLRHLAEEFVAGRLEHDMDALLAALYFDHTGRPVLDADQLSAVFHQPYSGHYYKIRSGDFVLRSRSLWDTDLTTPPTTREAVTRYLAEGPQAQWLLVLARSFRLQGREIELAVTEDFTELAAGLRQFYLGLGIIALLLLAILIGIQRLIVRQGLRPLEQTRYDILRLERGEIRQLQTDAPIEVRPLVEEINRLIELMGRRLQRSRHALGNLAHALKTPLTALIQLAEQSQIRAQDGFYTELKQQTQQIRSLIDRELRRARIAGAATPGQRVVLVHEVTDLVDTLKKIYRDKALTIQNRIPADSLFPGDRDDLLELLGNLLDNACQWAKSIVLLGATATDGRLRITIEDDGSGCSPEQLELLTRRGVRLDESRSGHGLGLAIVTEIVEQYGGHLRFGRSPELGGFLAEVDLPSPDTTTAAKRPGSEGRR